MINMSRSCSLKLVILYFRHSVSTSFGRRGRFCITQSLCPLINLPDLSVDLEWSWDKNAQQFPLNWFKSSIYRMRIFTFKIYFYTNCHFQLVISDLLYIYIYMQSLCQFWSHVALCLGMLHNDLYFINRAYNRL